MIMTDTGNWVQIVRDFDAPIDAIWPMWTDADAFASWYGPKGFSIPTSKIDASVDGTRLLMMQSPDGSMKMWFTGVFKEVDAPNRLVYTDAMCDETGKVLTPQELGMPDNMPTETEVHVDLTEQNGKTRMTMTHKGVPKGSPGEGGWMQAFDKLAEQLG